MGFFSISDILDHPIGNAFVSIILGLGFAVMFRSVCRGDNCVVVKSPPAKEIERTYYKQDNTCYRYKPLSVPCVSNSLEKRQT